MTATAMKAPSWGPSLRAQGGSQAPDLATAAIGIMLLCYPFSVFVPGVRVGEAIYFDIFRLAVLVVTYWLTLPFFAGRGIRLRFGRLDRLLLLFVISLAASIVWSIDRIATLREFNYLFYIGVFYLICMSLLRRETRWYRLRSTLILLPFMYLAGAVLFYLHFGSLRPQLSQLGEQALLIGPFPNYVAAGAETTIPFLFASMVLPTNGKELLLAVLGLAACAITIVISESRGSILTVALMTCLFFFLVMRKRGRLRSRAPLAILLVVSAGMGVLSSPWLENTRSDFYMRIMSIQTS